MLPTPLSGCLASREGHGEGGNLSNWDRLPPNVQGALKALNKNFRQSHTTFGDATRILCYDHIHETRCDDSEVCGDAFDKWCSHYPALSSHFSELTERRTIPSAFRAFFDFYIEMVAVNGRSIFAHLIEIGRQSEADSIVWAESEAEQLILNYRQWVGDWVRMACDRYVSDPWQAPLFLTMKPAGHARYDPDRVWERIDATRTLHLLEDLADEYVQRLEEYIADDAGTAYLERAKRPKPARRIIEAKVIEGNGRERAKRRPVQRAGTMQG